MPILHIFLPLDNDPLPVQPDQQRPQAQPKQATRTDNALAPGVPPSVGAFVPSVAPDLLRQAAAKPAVREDRTLMPVALGQAAGAQVPSIVTRVRVVAT